MEMGSPHVVSVQGVFEGDKAYVTNLAALGGMGIAMMPSYHARQCVETGLAEVMLDHFALALTSAHAVWPSGTQTPSRARRFVDLLAQRLKREAI
jgi:DNA-binding transcriptional LysR family regulator